VTLGCHFGDIALSVSILSLCQRYVNMAFTVPNFNLVCAIYTGPYDSRGLHRLVSPCNLAFGRRTQQDFNDPTAFGFGPARPTLLLPAGTDIRDISQNVASADIVEVPSSSGRWYVVNLVDDVAKGFANEYRVAALSKLSSGYAVAGTTGLWWPIPMP